MQNSKGFFRIVPLFLILVFCAGPTFSANKNPEREAMRKIQLMQKKAMEEKAVLEKENGDLAKQVSELTSQSGSLKEEAARASRSKTAVEKELEKLRAENNGLKEKLNVTDSNLLALQKKSVADQEISTQEKKKLETSLTVRAQSLASCEQKNSTLYEMNTELLGKYKKKGFLDALLQNEPFTQIESVKMESVLSDYKEKLETQRIDTTSNLQ